MAFRDKRILREVHISQGVTSIGAEAFYFCFSLSSVYIPNSVKSIGRSAFYMCRNLTSVDIPNSVEEIGDYTFTGCTGLVSINIPSSVTSIGNNAAKSFRTALSKCVNPRFTLEFDGAARSLVENFFGGIIESI